MRDQNPEIDFYTNIHKMPEANTVDDKRDPRDRSAADSGCSVRIASGEKRAEVCAIDTGTSVIQTNQYDTNGSSEKAPAQISLKDENDCQLDNVPTFNSADREEKQQIPDGSSKKIVTLVSEPVKSDVESDPLMNLDCKKCVSTSEQTPSMCKNNKTLERAMSCYDNPPDGGWGWVVTFAAFMVGLILDGISFSFGLFFKELLTHFNESKSLTSWIISVLNGTYLGIGPMTSMLVSVFGCRQVAVFGACMAAISFFLCTWSPNVQVMIILYGLLGGAGLGLLYLPSIVTVGHYFKKRRALATGIAVCGSGIGGFVFAPLSEFLIEHYTWKGAMWIISAVVLNGIPIAALLRPLEGAEEENKRRRNTAKDGAGVKLLNNGDAEESTTKCCDLSSMFDFELLRSPTFLVYGMSCFLCMLGFFIPFTYIPDLADEFGMTSQQGAMLISIIGILNTGARVVVGWLADRKWADALIINSVSLVIGGGATMFVPYFSIFAGMATYCVVFGISIAVFVSYRSVIVAELLGIEKLTSSFGLVTMCQGLSAFIGAPIAGALSDQAGDYEGAFYLAGAAIGLSGVICFPLRAISRWENSRNSKDIPDNANVFSSTISMEMGVHVKPVEKSK